VRRLRPRELPIRYLNVIDSKPVWTPILDTQTEQQITVRGKWREHLPTWERHNGVVWVLKDDKVGKRL
jgi:hypothetical protein